jgi:hypothetical protein
LQLRVCIAARFLVKNLGRCSPMLCLAEQLRQPSQAWVPHAVHTQVRATDAIKALDAQAQGEAMIRKALAELKMWGLQREFSLSESTSQVGRD